MESDECFQYITFFHGTHTRGTDQVIFCEGNGCYQIRMGRRHSERSQRRIGVYPQLSVGGRCSEQSSLWMESDLHHVLAHAHRALLSAPGDHIMQVQSFVLLVKTRVRLT